MKEHVTKRVWKVWGSDLKQNKVGKYTGWKCIINNCSFLRLHLFARWMLRSWFDWHDGFAGHDLSTRCTKSAFIVFRTHFNNKLHHCFLVAFWSWLSNANVRKWAISLLHIDGHWVSEEDTALCFLFPFHFLSSFVSFFNCSGNSPAGFTHIIFSTETFQLFQKACVITQKWNQKFRK